MARLKRCDLCGAEADELMSIEFPYEERWMIFFRKKSLAHYADICLDCLEEIRATRQKQIKMSDIEFEIADTPQTDCETCKYGQDKHRYAHICNECGIGINNYTPQTELTAKCLNCHNAKACKENHWDGCIYEPIADTPTPQTERPSCESCKWDSEEWYDSHCDSCVAHTDKPSNYEPKDEQQTECPKSCPSADICTKDDTDCPWK